MKKLLTVLFIIVVIYPAHAWEYIPSKSVYKEQLTNADSPTDIIFQSDSEWLLYSAYKGEVHSYHNGKKSSTYQSDKLKYGICFVQIDNEYFFCDTANNAVQELSIDYKSIAMITFTDGYKKFDPTDIVKSKGDIYIVDNDNHRIIKYNLASKEVVGRFGSHGTTKGNLRYPFSAVVDKDSLLYVVEVLNARVQMFSPVGRSTLNIGSWGVEPGSLYRPKGLALLENEYLIVSDGYTGILQIFDVYGRYIGVVADESGKPRKYSSPTRIRSHGNIVAILDYYDHTFEILEIRGRR